jgi:hypothetical protein
MDYDTKRLAALGKRMQRLREDADALRPQLTEEILAALHAGVRQVDIVKMTGYTRDAIRQMARRADQQ